MWHRSLRTNGPRCDSNRLVICSICHHSPLHVPPLLTASPLTICLQAAGSTRQQRRGCGRSCTGRGSGSGAVSDSCRASGCSGSATRSPRCSGSPRDAGRANRYRQRAHRRANCCPRFSASYDAHRHARRGARCFAGPSATCRAACCTRHVAGRRPSGSCALPHAAARRRDRRARRRCSYRRAARLARSQHAGPGCDLASGSACGRRRRAGGAAVPSHCGAAGAAHVRAAQRCARAARCQGTWP